MENPATTLSQKATAGVAWSAGFQISRQILSLISVSVLARCVPLSAYGVIGMAAILTNFLDTFRDLGTSYALVRERELPEKLLSTVFLLNCILGLVFTLAVIALSIPAALFFHEPRLAGVVQALSVVLLLNSLAVVPTAVLNRQMAFRQISLAQLAGAVLGTAAGIVAALRGAGVWSLVLGSLTNNLVTTVVLFAMAPWFPRWLLDWGAVRSIAAYALNLSGFNIVSYFSRNADNLVVGRFLGSVPLGYYQMAYTIMTYPLSYFSAVICQVLFPAMALVQHDNARLRWAFIRTCMLISLFTFPVMLGLTVTADPFVRVVLGNRWLPVIGILMVYGPLGMAQSIYTVIGLIYNAKGRADWQFRWGCVSSVLYVGSFFVGLRWGILGVAISYSIMWTLLMFPGFAIPFRLIELSGADFFRHLRPVLGASLIMAVVAGAWLKWLQWAGIGGAAVQLFSTAVVGAACYILILFRWKPPVLGELRSLLEHSDNTLAMKAAAWLPGPA